MSQPNWFRTALSSLPLPARVLLSSQIHLVLSVGSFFQSHFQTPVFIISAFAEHIFKTWCFSDRALWIDYILITNFDALIIIYS